MFKNKLKMNDGKAEFMIVADTHQQLAKRWIDHLLLETSSCITPASSVKNLGVWIDPGLSLEVQINLLLLLIQHKENKKVPLIRILCHLSPCTPPLPVDLTTVIVCILRPPCIPNIKTAQDTERSRQNYMPNLSLHTHYAVSYRSSFSKCSLLHSKRFMN